MSSKWVEHVKEFASKKEMRYSEAMKNEECRKPYQENKQSKPLEEMKEIARPISVKKVKKEIKKADDIFIPEPDVVEKKETMKPSKEMKRTKMSKTKIQKQIT